MRPLTEQDLVGWRANLDGLVAASGALFRRSEARQRFGRVLAGFLGNAERKNGWQLAEAIGETEPHGVQRLLAEAVWDADALRDVLRQYVVTHLGRPDGVLVIDETGFVKKGTHSVGVSRQYTGTAGKVENCQVGVFLTYASDRGHAFLDRALYLPERWTADRARLRAAGVPDAVDFATKPALARRMIDAAIAAGVPHAWTVGDSVYGEDGALRRALEEQGEAYALGLSGDHVIWEGGTARPVRDIVAAWPQTAWARLSAGRGSQGERWYDWAWLALADPDPRGLTRWLVARRTIGQTPADLAYFQVFGSATADLAAIAQVIGMRWTIEQCLEEAKGLTGLDQYEVRNWTPWYRHVTLALVAHAVLAISRLPAPRGNKEKGGPTESVLP